MDKGNIAERTGLKKKKIEKRRENWWIDSPSSESKRRNDNHDGVTIKSDRIKNWGASFGGPEITKKEKKEERKKIKENKKKPNPPTDLFVIRKKSETFDEKVKQSMRGENVKLICSSTF